MKAGTDYFGGVMRSAGLAGPGALPPARAAAGASDAFEPIESMQDAPALAPARSMPERVADVEAAATKTPAPTELPRPSPRIGELAHDPSPAVQAALRWIAAGEPAPMKPDAPVIASRDEAAHPTQRRPASVSSVSSVSSAPAASPQSASAAPPLQPQLREPTPPSPVAQAATRAPEVSTHAPAPSTRPGTPARAPQPRPAEASKATSRHAPEVHIGTLHVTLDAATAARFAPPAPAPRTVIAAPEAPRASAAPAASRSSGSQAAVGSGLSRSRLPRW